MERCQGQSQGQSRRDDFNRGHIDHRQKLLNKERPDYSHGDFLAEVIAHELWHAYEDCLDTVYHDENIARRVGEDVATELAIKTLDETRPAPPKKKKTVKKSDTT